MKNKILLAFVFMSLIALPGCALPVVSERLDSFVGKRFTNSTPYYWKNPDTNSSYVWTKPEEGENFYYKKEIEGPNIRYYIAVWLDLKYPCSYSLLVSPDDIILSWRNEGPKHVSKCQYG